MKYSGFHAYSLGDFHSIRRKFLCTMSASTDLSVYSRFREQHSPHDAVRRLLGFAVSLAVMDGWIAVFPIPCQKTLPGFRSNDAVRCLDPIPRLLQIRRKAVLPTPAHSCRSSKEIKEGVRRQPPGLPGSDIDPRHGIRHRFDQGDGVVRRGSLKLPQQIPAGSVKVGEQMLGTAGGLVAELGNIPRSHGGVDTHLLGQVRDGSRTGRYSYLTQIWPPGHLYTGGRTGKDPHIP